MDRTSLLKDIIEEKVEEYIDSSGLSEIFNSATGLKDIVESSGFRDFRQKLLRDLLEVAQDDGAIPEEDDETLTVQCQNSPPQASEGACSHRLLTELESSFSSSLTQDADYISLSHKRLSELAQSLDPRSCDVQHRREALRQIVGIPSIEAQVCDAWTIVPETLTADKQAIDRPGRGGSRKSSTYGIRQGLYDALRDDDPELNYFALKFIAKTFSSTFGNVKDCYFLFADYLEEQFTTDESTGLTISDGLDISKSKVEKLLRAFCLLHEFHKKLPYCWLRYSEKLMGALMDRCLSLLLSGCAPSLAVHSSIPNGRLTPLHLVSLLDPKAQWFSLWTRGAYGRRPMLSRIAKAKQIVSTWLTNCAYVFLRKPRPSSHTNRRSFYSSSHLEAAYFLHSLHALTTLFCFHETHSKILPVAITKDVIKQLSDQDRATLIKGKALPMRTFMKLFIEFLISLEYNAAMEDFVNKCFQRLAKSPIAAVSCFGLRVESTPQIAANRIRKFPSMSSLSKDCNQSKLDRHRDEKVHPNVCALLQAMSNVCSTVQGREYFAHSNAVRQVQTIAQILTNCLEVVAGDDFEDLCQEGASIAKILAKIVGHLCDVLSKTLLTPQNRHARIRFELPRKVLEVLKILKAKHNEASADIVELFEKALEIFIIALLKTPRGVELVESFDLLHYCVHHLLSPSNLTQNCFRLETDLMVSQIVSCAKGLRSLEKTAFVEHRFLEVWKRLEGCEPAIATSVEGYDDLEDSPNDLYNEKDSSDRGALLPADLTEMGIQKPFNRLLKLFANFTAVFEGLLRDSSPCGSDRSPPTAPQSLSAFLDRAVLLDSSTKLAKLCRPDEVQIFGLRFLSALLSSLDTFLLLESRFGVRRVLLNAQLQNNLDQEAVEDVQFLIDEGLIERNRLLVKCSLLGGPNERHLPPRSLCEHNADPYPYPIVTTLNSDHLEKYTASSKKVGYCPQCVKNIETTPMTLKRPISASLVSIVISSLQHPSIGQCKIENQLLLQFPRLQARIRNVAKFLPHMNKQIPVPPTVASSLLPSWKETAISLIVEYAFMSFASYNYGHRVHALDTTLPPTARMHDLADLLSYAGNLKNLGRVLSKGLQHLDHAGGDVKTSQESGDSFEPFDWFVALIFLLYNGSVSHAVDFLNRFQGTSLAHYLWSPVATTRPSSQHYTICHIFEMVFSCELPQLYNTFRLSGYSPSLVLRCWLSQYYLNYLDWSEILDFLLLCLLCGPETIAFSAVSVMRHLSTSLTTALQAQTHLLLLLEEPIKGFRFVDNLDFLELLVDKYSGEVINELKISSLD
ncbi:unnamed protein product [Hydatigera taeniaeformis]|uniref:Protein broad-minded n=1 Tax=Hydatigena taeniaeformis TaxID=6205 RepID=A0A0R3WJG8_HYDTA|nr:unnamed protein product [Hydatigera taeniaeformis]